MYDDARAAALLSRIVEADPERWSSTMQPTWALPKILWLDPQDRRVAHSADVVAADLAGHPVATDTSHALKTGYDLIADRWPTEAFERLGLRPEIFPEVVLPGTELGRVSTAKAQVTGVPAGTPIYAGMTDGCAAQIAAGALESRRLEFRSRHHPRPQGREQGPARGPDRCRLQPSPSRWRLAPRRCVEHRRRRPHHDASRRRSRRSRPGRPRARSDRRRDLPADQTRRTIPLRRSRRPRFRARRLPG